MASDAKPTNYLKLKDFLARNECVNRRTFTRWKRKGLIDCIQPGGPNTEILVPEDALERIERRKLEASQSTEAENCSSQDSNPPASHKLSGPTPKWKENLTQQQN